MGHGVAGVRDDSRWSYDGGTEGEIQILDPQVEYSSRTTLLDTTQISMFGNSDVVRTCERKVGQEMKAAGNMSRPPSVERYDDQHERLIVVLDILR